MIALLLDCRRNSSFGGRRGGETFRYLVPPLLRQKPMIDRFGVYIEAIGVVIR
jgi:hypothetical protein